MKKQLLMALVCAMLLAGCGSSDSSSDNGSTAATDSVTESVTDSAAESEAPPQEWDSKFVQITDYPSLKDAYAPFFPIGCALSDKVTSSYEYAELAKQQFNSMTAENSMKPENGMDASRGRNLPDKYVDHIPTKFNAAFKRPLEFAKENGIPVRGHTLLWHNQTPEGIFYVNYDKDTGELCDRELMLKRLENYIKDVMEWTNENYPGLIYAWDVVNEAIDDAGGIRKSLWYQTIGEDYIEKAFEYARKYAPEGTKLFYNDYNTYQQRKRSDIIKALKPVVEAGNIDGVGMQSHVGTYVTPSSFADTIKMFHDELGLEVQITELDVECGNGDDWEDKQAEYMGKLMKAVLDLKAEGVPITSFTIWGLTDDMSWKKDNKPLLFNSDLSRKKIFDAMIQAAEDAKNS